MPDGTGAAVRYVGVGKSYDGVPALHDLHLDIPAGQLLVLVGPSGSGKSTALRVLAGLEEPERGAVWVGGEDVTDRPPHRRGIAMVFQDLALYPHLTARENLAFGLRVARVPDDEISRRVEAVAGLLELGPVLDRHPDTLSGGQQQRVALARAMIREPGVYLMDEPLSNLDPQLRTIAREEIHDLHRRIGATTVYVTHDQSEAMTLGDRLVVLRDGRIQQVGTPQEVYDRPANTFVARFTGSPPMNIVEGGGVLGGPAGTHVGVRPEDLHVAGDGDTPVTGVVAAVHGLGSESVVHADCAGTRLAVRLPPRAPLRPGDRIGLRVDTGRVHRFDAATGDRVGA